MTTKQFLSLEWKQFRRSSFFEKGLAIKILMFLGALYFASLAILAGAGIFFLFKKAVPNQDPFILINNYLIYWVLGDLALRYFMQQLPVMNIKPMLLLPVKRQSVIQFLLLKTSFSFFNILPLLFFIPLVIVLMVQGYNPVMVLLWFAGILSISFSINFLNFILNKNTAVFVVVIALLASFIGLKYFGVFDISPYTGVFFLSFYNLGFTVLVPLALVLFLFKANYRLLRSNFYVDGAVQAKKEKFKNYNLEFLNRFGTLATFLKNDVKMITRNARPKQVLLISFFFLFYGLFFFTQDIYKEMPVVIAFAGVFVTGGFLMTFGQLVPSWDSEYYKLMMSQNVSYRQYLESKWLLMAIGCAVSFILSTPYIYFGWEIYVMIAAGASFNIGLNSFITLYGGALNRVPIELNQKAKAFSNTQGFNPTQLLISLPKILGPMIIFYIPYKLINFNAGIIALALSGLLGLVFKSYFLKLIENLYQKNKYKTISAFSEKK
ncbi:DUF5687 family protein [Psychroflexus sediminis]|uniref:ABC-2 type transport system permease protein n=1 Tax=Psychroflexus sediminis TaxID=470826 RepID=A0A1G7X651_9FLAO|nr:DUF5687 family protein [Psychroflexus sediminis]SDG79669.1 hypothetical protein SAMN04488027_107115 [Psychroflexus sediminis]